MKFKKTISILLALVMLALPLAPVNTSASTLFQTDSYRDQFMESVLVYSTFVQEHGYFFYTKSGTKCYSPYQARTAIQNRKRVNIDCVSVLNWALKDQGLTPAKSHFYTNKGNLVNYSGNLKRFSTVVTKNIAGKSLYNAAKCGALKPGDICALTGDKTGNHHTVIFVGYVKNGKTGGKELLEVVDSGSNSGHKFKNKRNGVILDYLEIAKKQKVHRVVRFSDTASKNW